MIQSEDFSQKALGIAIRPEADSITVKLSNPEFAELLAKANPNSSGVKQ